MRLTLGHLEFKIVLMYTRVEVSQVTQNVSEIHERGMGQKNKCEQYQKNRYMVSELTYKINLLKYNQSKKRISANEI